VSCFTNPIVVDQLRMLTRLGAETAVFHAEADSDVDRFLFRPTTTTGDYRAYLERAYGFLAPLEAALHGCGGLDHMVDLPARAKTPHVIRDLLALGRTMKEISELPLCLSVPAFRGAAAALGWMYVAERPLLASAVIRRHVATRLPSETRGATAYLSCYAGSVGSMWRELGVALDRVAATPAIGDRIVSASCDAFRTLGRWRLHDLGRHAMAPARAVG
jgi:heme oxygenase